MDLEVDFRVRALAEEVLDCGKGGAEASKAVRQRRRHAWHSNMGSQVRAEGS